MPYYSWLWDSDVKPKHILTRALPSLVWQFSTANFFLNFSKNISEKKFEKKSVHLFDFYFRKKGENVFWKIWFFFQKYQSAQNVQVGAGSQLQDWFVFWVLWLFWTELYQHITSTTHWTSKQHLQCVSPPEWTPQQLTEQVNNWHLQFISLSQNEPLSNLSPHSPLLYTVRAAVRSLYKPLPPGYNLYQAFKNFNLW